MDPNDPLGTERAYQFLIKALRADPIAGPAIKQAGEAWDAIPGVVREFKQDPAGSALGLATEGARAYMGLPERQPGAVDQTRDDLEYMRTHPEVAAGHSQLAMPFMANSSGKFWTGLPEHSAIGSNEGTAAYGPGHYATSIENIEGGYRRYGEQQLGPWRLDNTDLQSNAAAMRLNEIAKVKDAPGGLPPALVQETEDLLYDSLTRAGDVSLSLKAAIEPLEQRVAMDVGAPSSTVDDLIRGGGLSTEAEDAIMSLLDGWSVSQRSPVERALERAKKQQALNAQQIRDMAAVQDLLRNFDPRRITRDPGSVHIWEVPQARLLDYDKDLHSQPLWDQLLAENPVLADYLADPRRRAIFTPGAGAPSADLLKSLAYGPGSNFGNGSVSDLVETLGLVNPSRRGSGVGEELLQGLFVPNSFRSDPLPPGVGSHWADVRPGNGFRPSVKGEQVGLPDRLYPSKPEQRGIDVLDNMGITGHRYDGEGGSSRVPGGVDNYVLYGNQHVTDHGTWETPKDFFQSDKARDLWPAMESDMRTRLETRQQALGGDDTNTGAIKFLIDDLRKNIFGK